jgi:hypothetical protein
MLAAVGLSSAEVFTGRERSLELEIGEWVKLRGPPADSVPIVLFVGAAVRLLLRRSG